MGKLYFDDMFDLAYFMVENADNDKEVCAVFHYDEAKALLRELLLLADNYDIMALDLEPIDWGGYDKEFYITIDKYCGICVERVYKWDKYLGTGADIMLVSPDASSKVITCPTTEVDTMFEVSFDEPDCSDCAAKCENAEIASLVEDIFGVEPESVELSHEDGITKLKIIL